MRFVLGGTAVVLCYVISVISPVKFIGGVFAGFPAVMVAAVLMAGLKDGDREAAEVARGAVAGMIGCTACVLAALCLIGVMGSWPLGLVAAILVWGVTAGTGNMIISGKNRVLTGKK